MKARLSGKREAVVVVFDNQLTGLPANRAHRHAREVTAASIQAPLVAQLDQVGATHGPPPVPWTRSELTCQRRTAPGRKTVALGGDKRSGERARVRGAASPEGRAELRTRARRARRTPAAGGGNRSDGLGDDEREVMVALDLVGGAVPERGVQPSPVVELFDVLEDRAARLLMCGVGAPAQPLFLQ